RRTTQPVDITLTVRTQTKSPPFPYPTASRPLAARLPQIDQHIRHRPAAAGEHEADPVERLAGHARLDQLGALGRGRLRAHPRLRSEEHTSELQSRENAEYRLLLEKNKWKYEQ